jgi:flagellar hook-basal body complex protein FliE
MNEAMIPHLLGVNHQTISALKAGRLPGMLGQVGGNSDFATRLAELLGNSENKTSDGTAATDTLDRTAVPKGPQHMLADLFKDSVLASLQTDALTPEEQAEMGGDTERFENALSNGTLNINDVIDSPAISTAEDIVFRTGNANSDLIQKINSATSVSERLGFATELRDKIIEALKAEGHTAYDIGKADKISIDGTLYDVIKASRGLGMDSRVQFMKVPPATPEDMVKEAIYTSGEDTMDMMSQISGKSDASGRRMLAAQFRDGLVAKLNTAGYTASAGSSPDKIVVNGQTYDIIRNLNSPGSNASFHVMLAG